MKYFHQKLKLTLAIITCIFYSLSGQGTLELSKTISSNFLNQDEKYSVYLPENYNNNNNNGDYPILYLLHGYGGDENSWIKRAKINLILDSLIREAALPEVIVIFPNARNSYYINDYKNQYPFEDYFISEFVFFIDSAYTTSKNKLKRAIAGLSMGGFGATILPLKHPDLFGTSINLSGAVRTPEQFKALSPIKYHTYFAPLYGDSLKGYDRITAHWKENSPYYLVDSSNTEKLRTINWYIDCGMQDFLFPANNSLHDLCTEQNILHEYHTQPGNHSWKYWRKGIIQALIYWGNILEK